MGAITEIATSASGYSSVRPNNAAPLATDAAAERVRPPSLVSVMRCRCGSTSPMGPFDAVADRQRGFEYFYGFIGGETNQYSPRYYEGHDGGRAGEDAGRGLPLHRAT